MVSLRTVLCALTLVSLLTIPVAQVSAHPGHPGHEFGDGWRHPLEGYDHLLAMIAVGLLAVRLGGHGLWLAPAAFVFSMLTGGLAAHFGLWLPGVEFAIMTSVLVLGLLVAATRVAPLWVGVGLVALFAFFHGHAHAAELAGEALGLYAAGFVLSTALLHIAGIVGGVLLYRWVDARPVRWAGGAISAAGALMLCGAI